MPYAYYNRTVGTANDSFSFQQLGYKMTPFVKTGIRNQPYYRVEHRFVDGNSSMRSGGTYAGEQNYLGSNCVKGSVLDNTITIPLGPCSTAYARAYEKFKSKVYTQATNLTALKERGKTFEMVGNRLLQLWKGAKALKKGRFREFLRTFGIKPLPKHAHRRWARPKEFSGLWLEYWMGWAPTVGDVYSSLEFLGGEIPTTTVRAGSAVALSDRSSSWSPFGEYRTNVAEGKVAVWIQADVELTNPTLYNLNGLGLINPAKTVWETIPFSWLVDWFTNVGQVLGQLTDWVGLKLNNLVVSSLTKGKLGFRSTNTPSSGKLLWRNREFTSFYRKVGGSLPVVKPIIRLPNGLSITRGLTLTSLLIQIFSPAKA